MLKSNQPGLQPLLVICWIIEKYLSVIWTVFYVRSRPLKFTSVFQHPNIPLKEIKCVSPTKNHPLVDCYTMGLFNLFLDRMFNQLDRVSSVLIDFDRTSNHILCWWNYKTTHFDGLGMMHEDDTRESNYVFQIDVVI